VGSPPVPCTAPWSRDPPRPTYLVHAHAGINPIGQVSAFGFAPRVHVEPSSPERVAVPGAPCAHMGKRRAAAAAAQGYSPSVTRTHGISHRRAGSHSGAPSSSLCRRRAATECLCADPVCSVCTLPVRSIGDPLLEQERGVNPSCPLIRGGGAGGALRVTWCALCRECWRERRGREPPAYGEWQHHCPASGHDSEQLWVGGTPGAPREWLLVGCFALGSLWRAESPAPRIGTQAASLLSCLPLPGAEKGCRKLAGHQPKLCPGRCHSFSPPVLLGCPKS